MKNLKTLRNEKGISQQKLAQIVGTNQQNIQRYENGLNEPDIKMLICFANFFETSIDYIVGYSDVRQKIERLQEYDLNEEEASLINGFRNLGARERQGVRMMVDTLLNEKLIDPQVFLYNSNPT